MTDLREKTEQPERVWLQFANDQDGVPLLIRKWSHEPFDGGAEYVKADTITTLRRERDEARADLARFRSERSYVIGCNTGWDEAIEEAVKVLEDYAQRLVPDPANDRARYHVRCAADDVRALAAGKEGVQR